MSTTNLLNSLNSETATFDHLHTAAMKPPLTAAAAAAASYFQDPIPFSDHLPGLQAACSMQTSPAGSSAWLNTNLPPSPPPSFAAAAPARESSGTADSGDGCCSSSFGGTQMWSELLADPIFDDMA